MRARRPTGVVVRGVAGAIAAALIVATSAGHWSPPASAPTESLGPQHVGTSAVPSLAKAAAPDVRTATIGSPRASAADSAAADAGLAPSIQYDQALAHARDKIDFRPGGRVTIGFSPPDGDSWTVDGSTPGVLPAGRLDGAVMRREALGHVRVVPTPSSSRPSASIDLPSQGATSGRALTASARVAPPTHATASGRGTSTGTVATEAPIARTGLRREVFGFLPYWELAAPSLHIDNSRISTIAYFGVGTDSAGNLQKRNRDGGVTVGWAGWTSSRLTSVISAAHRSHTRVVLTVQSFGWNPTGLAAQRALLGSPSARANLARQIVAAVRDRGADGVNLDFEPLAQGAETGFTALVRSIRAQFDRIRHGYQVTFDAMGSIGNYPIEAATAAGGADAVFVMGYDYRTATSSPAGSIAPVNRSNGIDIVDTIRSYTARIPASKVILGVPWYGRAWSTSTNALHAANVSSSTTGASAAVDYDTAIDYLRQYGRRYDPTEAVAWTAYRRKACAAAGCVTSWRQLYIDDAASMATKLDLVNQSGLRGAGIWALGYDGSHPELWNVIKRKFIDDTTPPTVGIRALAAQQHNPAFAVSWTGTDDVGIRTWDVQASIDGQPWTPWLTTTTATAATWFGDDSHRYAFRVRARDHSGNASAWNVASVAPATTPSSLAIRGFGVVRTDGLPVRAAWGTSARKVGSLAAGDRIGLLAGPRFADGYTWYEIVGPLTTWGPITPGYSNRWVAVAGSGRRNVDPGPPPNTTAVAAMIGRLQLGSRASLGPSPAAVAARTFSPNGDGSRDALWIQFTNGTRLTSLVVRVWRADGTLVGDIPSNQLAPGGRVITWNGRVAGHRLADGRYLVSVIGKAGSATWFNPVATFRAAALATYGVTIDTVGPKVLSASAGGDLLSANGDGFLDALRFNLTATGAATWAFGVAPVQGGSLGAPILIRSGVGGRAAATWDGRTSGGTMAPDGTYRVQLLVADAAGNRATRTWTVHLDRTPPVVALSAPGRFSPNHDGVADVARLSWTFNEPARGTAAVYRGAALVRSWAITPSTSGAVGWTGTTRTGAAAPDGTYSFRVSVRDAAGNLTTRSASVIVDRTLSRLAWSAPAFFPQDGDALAARATLAFRLVRTAKVSLAILSGPTVVRTVWSSRTVGPGTHAWTWDGRVDGGAFAPRGTYVARLTAVTALGTSVLTQLIVADAYRISQPSTVVAGQQLVVTISAVEPLAAAPTVWLSQPSKATVRRTATSLGHGVYRVAFSVPTGWHGAASIVVTGRDVAGGLDVTSRTVTIR